MDKQLLNSEYFTALTKNIQGLTTEYKLVSEAGLFDIEEMRKRTPELQSPLQSDYNHIIAVVFNNVDIDGKLIEFFLDKNGLHFYKYEYELATPDSGVQVHIVYRSEYENLAWVETRSFHEGNTYCYTRYLKGSEASIFREKTDWETIYHG